MVEKAGYRNAGIKAKEFVHGSDGTTLKAFKAYTFIIQKKDNGAWVFIEDEESN